MPRTVRYQCPCPALLVPGDSLQSVCCTRSTFLCIILIESCNGLSFAPFSKWGHQSQHKLYTRGNTGFPTASPIFSAPTPQWCTEYLWITHTHIHTNLVHQICPEYTACSHKAVGAGCYQEKKMLMGPWVGSQYLSEIETCGYTARATLRMIIINNGSNKT